MVLPERGLTLLLVVRPQASAWLNVNAISTDQGIRRGMIAGICSLVLGLLPWGCLRVRWAT